MTLNGGKVEGQVTEAHDPPLYGMERDLVPRTAEPYVKDFKPMKLGTFDLKAGRGQLTFRAPQVAGNHVMDVRYVVLNRAE